MGETRIKSVPGGSCTCDNLKTELTENCQVAVSLSHCLSACLSSSLSACLYVCCSACLSFCRSVYLFVPQKLEVEPPEMVSSVGVKYSCGNSSCHVAWEIRLITFAVCVCGLTKGSGFAVPSPWQDVIPAPLHKAGRQAGRLEGRRHALWHWGPQKQQPDSNLF